MASRHWGQIDRVGAAILYCVRRLRPRVLECRRLGRGIRWLLVFSGNHLDRRAAHVLSGAHRGSSTVTAHWQLLTFRLAPQTGHNPRQSSWQRGFIGSRSVVSVSSTVVRSRRPLSYTSVSRSSVPSSTSSPRRRGFGTKRASTWGVTVTTYGSRQRPQCWGTRATSRPLTKTASPSFSTVRDRSSRAQAGS